MRRFLTLAAVLVLTAADQLIKIAADNFLSGGRVIRLGSFLAFRYVENTGMAFSMLSGKTVLLSVVTAVMLVTILAILLSGKVKSNVLYASLTLIVSGGAGNLYDRIFRGFVIDYIEPLFVDFAVFNFADCLITVGSFGMILYLILDIIKEKKGKEQKS
ncbi:MAG: signal peptidase II [Clostridia bacterium]|nr:signal peptidase II [Clostridia bacterium]